MFHMIGSHGHPEGWNVAYYISTATRGVLFFVVVILIATGWSYMKPFLAEREKQILMVVVPLQVGGWGGGWGWGLEGSECGFRAQNLGFRTRV